MGREYPPTHSFSIIRIRWSPAATIPAIPQSALLTAPFTKRSLFIYFSHLPEDAEILKMNTSPSIGIDNQNHWPMALHMQEG